MKKILTAALSLLSAALLMGAMPTEADAEIYSDTLRLHILAPSDSDEDQALKLAVRDAILAEYSAELSGSAGFDAALAEAEVLLCDIKATAERCIKENGYDYSVEVSLGEEWYDTREYGDFSLPRGVYSSLIVKIGEGAGRNWWCVMYPPMCLDMALDAPSDDWVEDYTDEELSLISGGKYRVKFKLLELISDFID